MPAYVIANYRITHDEGYAPYPESVAPTLVPLGGDLLVADFASHAVEGSPEAVSVVVRLPSKDAEQRWYDSDGYKAVRDLRIDNSEGTLLIARGIDAS